MWSQLSHLMLEAGADGPILVVLKWLNATAYLAMGLWFSPKIVVLFRRRGAQAGRLDPIWALLSLFALNRTWFIWTVDFLEPRRAICQVVGYLVSLATAMWIVRVSRWYPAG